MYANGDGPMAKSEQDKDKAFNEALERLKKAPVVTRREPVKLPSDLSDLLYLEDPPNIQTERYFVTDRADEIYNKIDTLSAVAGQMKQKNIKFLNSALLYGESGTGKTQFGRYVASKMDLPFVFINLSTIRGGIMGQTSYQLDKVFKYIRKTSCVFMMDELDTIAGKRGGEMGSLSGESDRIVTSIIQLMDSLGNDVILLAATNRMDTIDDAVVRRFRIREEFKRLSGDEAVKMALKYLIDCEIKFNAEDLNVFSSSPWNPSTIENILVDSIADHLINGTPFKLLRGGING